MVRVKVPYGSITPEQLDMFAHIADTYCRGWGHITTRQNIQFHFVDLEQVPAVAARPGVRRAHHPRGLRRHRPQRHGLPPRRRLPLRGLDISPWAEAAFQHFLRHPLAQRLPRKFKINFSGCDTDCGQAMFNDVGVIAATRTLDDGTVEAGFRVFVAGGLGANPHPALALEEFTPREDLLATLEAILRVFANHGNRDNKLRARMKWLVDTMGWDELQARILKERKFLVASSTWPGGIPDAVAEAGRRPRRARPRRRPHADRPGHARHAPPRRPVQGAGTTPTSCGAWPRAPCRPSPTPGSATSPPTSSGRWPRSSASSGAEVRVTNRQNLVFRGLTEDQLPILYQRLAAIGMAEPGAELARDVVACPGADTCNLAVTQSRGLADAIGAALDEAGLADVGGIRTNISGCTNSCGQHHISDIGFFGAERRAHGQSAPGYQMLLGGYVGQEKIHFGEKALRLPAKNAPEAAVRVVRRFADEREAGEVFRSWMDRVRRRQGHRRGPPGPRRVPHPRGRPRVLRRLRRDRPLRGRDRRLGVRDVSC